MKKTALSQLIEKLDARIAANENTRRHVLLTDIRFEANLLRQEERRNLTTIKKALSKSNEYLQAVSDSGVLEQLSKDKIDNRIMLNKQLL